MHVRLVVIGLIALGRRLGRAGGDVSDEAHSRDRALRGGQHGRNGAPPDRSRDRAEARAAPRHRVPSGSGRQYRRASGRHSGARRLHVAARRHQQFFHQPIPVRQHGVRSADRIRADRHAGRPAVHDVRQRTASGRHHQRDRRLAKAKVGGLSYASSGVGSPPHLGGALFGQVAGIELTHVPYRSNAQSLTALLANDVQLYFGLIGGAQEHADAGRLRIIAAAGPTRSANFPNVPSAAEAGYPNFRISNWWALAAPQKTPAAVTERLSGEIRTALANRAAARQADADGNGPARRGAAELAARMRSEARYGATSSQLPRSR